MLSLTFTDERNLTRRVQDEHCVPDPFTSIASPVLQELSINDHGITQEGTLTEISSGLPSVVNSPKVVMFVRTAGVCCGRIDKGVSEADQI
uniref:Uncharacterized protein n=1 Tax=Amphimedon queenslandica TaxID=400682 RepID=A0A1X7TX43_AMPQE